MLQAGQRRVAGGLRELVGGLLAAMPEEWRGTTFNNTRLLGRGEFSRRLQQLLEAKAGGGQPLTSGDLAALGNAEDYARVATNMSVSLELVLAQEHGLDITQVFTFASASMPLVAVAFATQRRVRLYAGGSSAPLSEGALATLGRLGCNLEVHAGEAPRERPPGVVVLALGEGPSIQHDAAAVDGVVAPNVLYILNTEAIVPNGIMVVRKRMATPMTTPATEAQLRALGGMTAEKDLRLVQPDATRVETFYVHLQRMSGTEVNKSANPVIFSAGLPALAAFFTTLIELGGVSVLMASTAYGGSSQLNDLLAQYSSTFKKFTFDIQGAVDMVASVEGQLNELALLPGLPDTTVVFLESPTNPDMKVVDLQRAVDAIARYKAVSAKRVFLLMDTTFAPTSQIMKQIRELDAQLPVVCFISLSKSVSRGLTTGGAVIANHTEASTRLVQKVAHTAQMLDTTARPDQLHAMVDNHIGVEQRAQAAYDVALAVGERLQRAVWEHRGQDMPLNFVSPQSAEMGYTSPAFSFNLPCLEGATVEANEALAQDFVDLLTSRPGFKPCVSFGQDNGLVYCTVPATSTQGAIKAADKDKQALGGVQLVRLSFPPACDVSAVGQAIAEAVAAVYSRPPAAAASDQGHGGRVA